MKKINRILIDCTDTYKGNLNTGIQRVVRNIVERSERISEKTGIKALPIIFDKNGYVSLEKWLDRKKNYKYASKTLKATLINRIKITLKKFNIDEKTKIYIILKYVSRKLLKLKYFFISFMQSLIYFNYNDVILPEKKDILFVPDGFWGSEHKEYFIFFCKRIKKNYGIIVLLIYDIMPLTDQEFFSKDFVKSFKQMLFKLLYCNLIDIIFTISESEMKNIINYLNSKKFIDKNIKYVSFFYLGCDFTNEQRNKTTNFSDKNYNVIRKDLVDLSYKLNNEAIKKNEIVSTRLYLMVGNIDIRKGQGYVLEAFEDLWSHGFEGLLVIVGRLGYGGEELINKLYNSIYINEKLFVYTDLSDRELDYIYKNAYSVICASFREGFGLPIIEAMSYDIPLFAADIPVFREIGRQYPIYFNPDKESLKMTIINSEDISYKKHISNSKIVKNYLDWDNSVDMLCTKLNEMLPYIIKQ